MCLEGVGERETIIRIYYMENKFSITKRNWIDNFYKLLCLKTKDRDVVQVVEFYLQQHINWRWLHTNSSSTQEAEEGKSEIVLPL